MDHDLSAATWRKSSRSSGGGSNCVEVAVLVERVAIRDSKDVGADPLIVAPAAFRELTDEIKRGRLGC